MNAGRRVRRSDSARGATFSWVRTGSTDRTRVVRRRGQPLVPAPPPPNRLGNRGIAFAIQTAVDQHAVEALHEVAVLLARVGRGDGHTRIAWAVERGGALRIIAADFAAAHRIDAHRASSRDCVRGARTVLEIELVAACLHAGLRTVVASANPARGGGSGVTRGRRACGAARTAFHVVRGRSAAGRCAARASARSAGTQRTTVRASGAARSRTGLCARARLRARAVAGGSRRTRLATRGKCND